MRSKIFTHSDSTPRAQATVLVKAQTKNEPYCPKEDRLLTKKQNRYAVPPGTRLQLAAHLEIDNGGYIDTQRLQIALEAAAPIFFRKWFEMSPHWKRPQTRKRKKP